VRFNGGTISKLTLKTSFKIYLRLLVTT